MKRHDDSISDRLRRMAATDELSVGRGRAEQIASRAMSRAVSRPRLRSLAAAVAGSAFAIVSITGLGAIADSAAPGDSLYPVDRAYEAVGRAIGQSGDRTQETLEEAITLAQRGDRDRAFVHVASELGSVIERDIVRAVPADSQTIVTVAAPESVVEPKETPEPTESAGVVAAEESAEPQQQDSPASAVEPAVEPTTPTAPAVLTADQAADDGAAEDVVDPFLLALENALRATQAAAGSADELTVAEADEAVKSVLELAAGVSDEDSGAQTADADEAGLEPQVAEETTTTTTTVQRGNSANAPGNGANAPGNSTTTTTTTSVQGDSEEDPPGDGETAGDDSSGVQEGSGSAGEPGEDGAESPGPVILPIP